MQRRFPAAVALVVVWSWPACARAPVAAPDGDGELVLELGRGHRSLAASLRGLGVELLPPPATAAATASAPGDAPDPPAAAPAALQAPAERRDEPQPGTAPAKAPSNTATAAPGWFEVVLQPRQTPIDLAREHLGSGARFKEILQCNGWSEADARRLRAGQKVRIPRATKAP